MSFIDIHGHYAWDIDDGMPSLEDAKKALEKAKNNRISTIVATPHVVSGKHTLKDLDKHELLFICLSGLATGASWLCYYKALQMGPASVVVPIDKLSVVITLILAFTFLHEQFTMKSIIGSILITAGTLFMVL